MHELYQIPNQIKCWFHQIPKLLIIDPIESPQQKVILHSTLYQIAETNTNTPIKNLIILSLKKKFEIDYPCLNFLNHLHFLNPKKKKKNSQVMNSNPII